MTRDLPNAMGAMGIARVYTPKDFELNAIMLDIVAIFAPDSGHINVG